MIPLADHATLWCAYSVTSQHMRQLFYVGACPLSELSRFPDARRNTEWRRLQPTDLIKLTILTLATESECERIKDGLAPLAWSNMNGQTTASWSKRIRCVETGAIYEQRSDAAAALGVTQSAISTHLNHPDKLPRIKGQTFERIG